MLNRYRDIGVCKEDITLFVRIVKNDIGCIPEEQLRSIAKGIIFFKRTFGHGENLQDYYFKCLVSDLLNLIHSLGIKSQRLYYTTYRSMIENFVRVILKYDNLNDTGVRNMFNELHRNYANIGNEFINYLEGEYGKCCNVVHSNIRASLKLYNYYEEVVNVDEMNQDTVISCANSFKTFLNKAKKFILECIPFVVDESFYNHKELLEFLIGKKYYLKFKNTSKS